VSGSDLPEAVARLYSEHATMQRNLTATQRRCNELKIEARVLHAQLAFLKTQIPLKHWVEAQLEVELEKISQKIRSE